MPIQKVKVQDVSSSAYIAKFAEILKKDEGIKLPEWVEYTKTAASKEMSPMDKDWIYTRIASVARRLYCSPKGLGVGKLSKIYGTPKNRGNRPSHHCKASGHILRFALSVLENMEYASFNNKNVRVLTRKGREEMEKIALSIRA